jgi:hypothetical protein
LRGKKKTVFGIAKGSVRIGHFIVNGVQLVCAAKVELFGWFFEEKKVAEPSWVSTGLVAD